MHEVLAPLPHEQRGSPLKQGTQRWADQSQHYPVIEAIRAPRSFPWRSCALRRRRSDPSALTVLLTLSAC